MSAPTLTSSLLDKLPWLTHAFQPAGAPAPAGTRYAQQRHTAQVVTSSAAWPPKSIEADGVISEADETVAVYTADCLPVLIADTQQRRVAAVHGGLKGVMAGVLQQAVARLVTTGSAPQHLQVAIGPSIGACCYELGADILQQMRDTPALAGVPLVWQASPVARASAVRPTAPQHANSLRFDLPALARQLLQREGIPAAQIDVLDMCTYCQAEAQASYRRNTHSGEGYALRFSWIRCLG